MSDISFVSASFKDIKLVLLFSYLSGVVKGEVAHVLYTLFFENKNTSTTSYKVFLNVFYAAMRARLLG